MRGDIEELSRKQKFDRVLRIGALEFVSDPRCALARPAEHLAPTGRSVVFAARSPESER